MTDTATLQRSYDRNLGYARFWLGVGIAVLSLLFTFGYDLIFGDTANPKPPPAPAAVPEPTLEIIALLALVALIVLAVFCFYLTLHFRVLYRRDNAALVRIARSNQNHHQEEEVTQ